MHALWPPRNTKHVAHASSQTTRATDGGWVGAYIGSKASGGMGGRMSSANSLPAWRGEASGVAGASIFTSGRRARRNITAQHSELPLRVQGNSASTSTTLQLYADTQRNTRHRARNMADRARDTLWGAGYHYTPVPLLGHW